MKIKANFNNITGKIKPMHAINQPPVPYVSLYHYLEEAGVPYSRTHDVGGGYGGFKYVDIPNIFRDFDADENNPASYDFAFTDKFLSELMKYNIKPFFRLGVTIEGDHMVNAYRIFPPKDYAKWARVCEHVIRHYNEGWANGFHMGIEHWEIWNEPDCCYKPEESNMWRGTPEEYYELYSVTANHLKKCFGDKIKIGGYAAIGLYDYAKDPEGKGLSKNREDFTQREFYIQFFHDFLKYITSEEHKAPIDFFSWHSYETFDFLIPQAKYVRRVLENYGLGHVEDYLNEWNLCWRVWNRATVLAPVSTLSAMLALQKEGTGMMMYYDARLGASRYGGMFNPESHKPFLNYYAFLMFNQLYKLENEVETSSDCDKVFVGAAKNDKKKTLILTNLSEEEKEIEFELEGVNTNDVEILMIDDFYQYSCTGKKFKAEKFVVPPTSCIEIRFN